MRRSRKSDYNYIVDVFTAILDIVESNKNDKEYLSVVAGLYCSPEDANNNDLFGTEPLDV